MRRAGDAREIGYRERDNTQIFCSEKPAGVLFFLLCVDSLIDEALKSQSLRNIGIFGTPFLWLFYQVSVILAAEAKTCTFIMMINTREDIQEIQYANNISRKKMVA